MPDFPGLPDQIYAASAVESAAVALAQAPEFVRALRDIPERDFCNPWLGAGVSRDAERDAWCSAPFLLSTWKRPGVIQREHAGPGRAAGVRFRARRHREHPAARAGYGAAGIPAGVHRVVS